MKAAVEQAAGVAARTDCLRHVWYEQVVDIAYRDLAAAELPSENEGAGETGGRSLIRGATGSLRSNNLEQTALAEASLELAIGIALQSLGANEPANLRYAVMGLGRLGHRGMDYGSDLDLLVVFDDEGDWNPSVCGGQYGTAKEFYAALTSQLIRILSAVTREGFLYHVDLRLRPEGQSGPLAHGLSSLAAYLRERASGWEHSAYLKVREVAGDPAFGLRVREEICEAAFAAAARNQSLKQELAHVRARLESEKARSNKRNIKWGPGGMTDVYFITRYLQLRDRVNFPTERGTTELIEHLGKIGSLDREAAARLFDGYIFLRRLDHWIRLLVDRPAALLPTSPTSLGDIASAMKSGSIDELERDYADATSAIRAVYEQVFASD
jgi:glutamate-ammonia-ligase adenylyltransferase